MQALVHADGVISIVREYFEERLGVLNIEMTQICFCLHNLSCKVSTESPVIVPNTEKGYVQIHISSKLTPEWYPNQLLYQFSHELWHAYEFALYGINYAWYEYESEIEPYAYAASLCILSKNLIPSSIISLEAQLKYFEAQKTNGPGRDIYVPGEIIAQDVHYDLEQLYALYKKKIAPKIVSTRT